MPTSSLTTKGLALKRRVTSKPTFYICSKHLVCGGAFATAGSVAALIGKSLTTLFGRAFVHRTRYLKDLLIGTLEHGDIRGCL